MAKKKSQSKKENKYTKKQVLASKKFAYSRDLINALLSDNKTYTLEEVDKEIATFMTRKVN